MNIEVEEGYELLAEVLTEALNQAQHGKGKQCHGNGRPFLEQPIMVGAREVGAGGLAFQSRKKILEATNCKDGGRAIEDLLGAINYCAAQIILRREGRQTRKEVGPIAQEAQKVEGRTCKTCGYLYFSIESCPLCAFDTISFNRGEAAEKKEPTDG